MLKANVFILIFKQSSEINYSIIYIIRLRVRAHSIDLKLCIDFKFEVTEVNEVNSSLGNVMIELKLDEPHWNILSK